jgi:hypothetical protein
MKVKISAVDGKIILKQILDKWVVKIRNGFNGSGWGPVIGFCSHNNEILVPLQVGNY